MFRLFLRFLDKLQYDRTFEVSGRTDVFVDIDARNIGFGFEIDFISSGMTNGRIMFAFFTIGFTRWPR